MRLEYYDERLEINTVLIIKQVNKDKWEYSLIVDDKLFKQLISCSPIHMSKKTNAYKMLKLLVNLYNIWNDRVTDERINELIMPELIEQYHQEVQNPLYIALQNLLTPPPAELIKECNSTKNLWKDYRLRNSKIKDKYFFTTADLRYRLRYNTYYNSITNIDEELKSLMRQNLIYYLLSQVKINGKMYDVWYLLD